jgi:gamma-glutamylputrescine oxidase
MGRRRFGYAPTMPDRPTSASDTWYASTCREPALAAAPLDRHETATIGIVGGGLAGLALALGLAERGATAVLLEAATVGAGASGRNGGLLSAGFTRSFADLRRRLGEAHAQELFRLSHAAVGLVEHRIAQGAIACRPRYGVLEASWFDRPQVLEAEVEEQNRLFGRELRFWPRAQLRQLYRSARYHDGIFDPQARHLDPLALCRGYARLARARGVRLFEHSPVERLERRAGRQGEQGAGWRAATRGGFVLEVDQLVLATNATTRHLAPALGRGLVPVNTYIIVSEPLPDTRELPIRAAYAVYDDRFATGYYRLVEDRATGGRRLLWGGRIGLGAAPRDLARRLRADLARVYPELADLEVAHGWAGRMGFARHRMPVVAPLAPGLWTTTGFAGHGLNTTTMAGELLAAALVEGSDQWRLLAPFGLAWTGGWLGPLAAQALYHGRALGEDITAFWHRHRQHRYPRARPEPQRR